MSHLPAASRLLSSREIATVTGLTRRQVFHHASAGRIPTFKVGRSIFAREDAVRSWLAAREESAKKALEL